MESLKQIIRYGMIGFLSNFIGYCIYLLITSIGVNPKLAMTVLYVSAATFGYFANKRLTFNDTGNSVNSGLRYLLAHALGYLMNLSILIVFVDQLMFPHQMVQMIAILVVAAFLFIVFKYFVFQHSDPE